MTHRLKASSLVLLEGTYTTKSFVREEEGEGSSIPSHRSCSSQNTSKPEVQPSELAQVTHCYAKP